MALLGKTCLAIGLLGATSAFALSLLSARLESENFWRWARRSSAACVLALSLALLLLLLALARRDFRLAYVASHTDRALPMVYALSALYAGQEGSLLFWSWILACLALTLARGNDEIRFVAVSSALLLSTLLLFLIPLAFLLDPFAVLPHPLREGRGLNPLLQNFFMVVHPPLIYLGMAGALVPASFVLGALCCRRFGPEVAERIRRPSLLSWTALTLGILTGAVWSYLELGWGGYWMWDPVENASLMPWLALTALLHSLSLHRRFDASRAGTALFSWATFLLVILGVAIARGGTVPSVHAFLEGGMGTPLLLCLPLFALLFAVATLKSLRILRGRATNPLSRGGALSLALWLLGLSALAVLVGTVWPLFGEARRAGLVVEPSFYHRTAIPPLLLALPLLSCLPFIGWRKGRLRGWLKGLTISLLFAFVAGFILWWRGVNRFEALLTVSLPVGAMATFLLFPRRLPSFLAHLGFAVVCLGLSTSSCLKGEAQALLRPRQFVRAKGFRARLLSLERVRTARYEALVAVVAVERGEKRVALLRPQLRSYRPRGTKCREVAVKFTIWRDFYAALAEAKGERALLLFSVSPLASWVWAGGCLLALAGLIRFWRARACPSPK